VPERPRQDSSVQDGQTRTRREKTDEGWRGVDELERRGAEENIRCSM
jgi:hypothetical protein